MRFFGKRLLAEEFREQSSWIGKLLQSINDQTQQLTQLFDNKITFSDNMSFQIQEIDVTVQASNTYPIFVKPKYNIKPVGIWIGNIQEQAATPAIRTTAVDIDWVFEGTQIRINNIIGLTTSKRYKITLFISFG